MTWRVGTKNPHALYEHDEPVGLVIKPRDGERIVKTMLAVDRIDDILRQKLAPKLALTAVLLALRTCGKGKR
jgi:hypothetical protein